MEYDTFAVNFGAVFVPKFDTIFGRISHTLRPYFRIFYWGKVENSIIEIEKKVKI